MRRLPLISVALIALIALIALAVTSPATAHPVIPHASGCANSFISDGHPGPWRTRTNGGTYHGNTIKVDCPTQSTSWSGRYCIQLDLDDSGGVVWANAVCTNMSGTGDQQFNFSWDPEPCTPHDARTHVQNDQTGGTINKPSGGNGVQMGC